MSLWQQLWHQAVQWCRRRRGLLRGPRRAGLDLEQLGHRQLLAVNFTGNVFNDFPATTGAVGSGIVSLQRTDPTDGAIVLPTDVAQYVEFSGFDITGVRLVYNQTTDTLDVGIQQPINATGATPPGASPTIAGNPVIAGDADDNGDGGTVNPVFVANDPARGNDFIDYPNLGGSEFLGIGLDLRNRLATNPNNTVDDVVAGIAGDPLGDKSYQVAAFSPTAVNNFGVPLDRFTGSIHLSNTPTTGGFEFSINHFSELYAAETGQTFNSNSLIGVRAFGGSANDDGIGESNFGEQEARLGPLPPVPPPPPPPPPPPVVFCPPQNPQTLINYHENNHVNTAHSGLVRVSVLGNSAFDVTEIDPTSVRLGGARPVASFFRHVNRDQFLDETFVFRANQISLPSGFTNATLTGNINNGEPANANTFSTTVSIFNRDDSYYTAGQLASTEARRERIDGTLPAFLAGDAIAGSTASGSSVSAASAVGHTVRVAAVLPAEKATNARESAKAVKSSKGKYDFKPLRVSSAAAKSLSTPD